jgi:hypothetical protein
LKNQPQLLSSVYLLHTRLADSPGAIPAPMSKNTYASPSSDARSFVILLSVLLLTLNV